MKKMILTLAIVFFAASASAQTLQDFESSFDDNFQKDLAGGEDFMGTINFSSGVERPVPLMVEATVEAENTEFEKGDLKGEEFDVAAGLFSKGFDWKPTVWEFVQQGDGEILLAEESVRDNDSVPEAVYVSQPLEVEEELPEGYSLVNTREELENVDLTYDPETTPGDTMELHDYSGDAGYLPVAAPVNDDIEVVGSFEVPEELNASHYKLAAPVSSPPPPEEEMGLWFDRGIERLDENTLRYSFTLDDISVYPESSNSVRIYVGADRRIKPDSFDFSFDVKSEVGVSGENTTEEVEASEPENVEAGDTEVSVNASADANVTVQTVEQVSAQDPSPGSDFVSGVSVDVSNSSGEVEASGNVSISYDQDYIEDNNLDEDSMQVYYYNSTQDMWTSEDVEVIQRDTVQNTVTAEADHFSTYAAFAEEQEMTDDDTGGSGGGIEGYFEQQDESEENQTEVEQDDSTDQTEDTEDGQPTDGEQTDETNQTESDETAGDETGSEDSVSDEDAEDGPQQSITGEFVSGPSGVAVSVLALIVVLVAILEYRRGLGIRESLGDLR